MRLNENGLVDKKAFMDAGFEVPKYDRASVREKTKEHPYWLHMGAGNIFRAFQANLVEELLNQKILDRGLIVAEGFDGEIIEKINRRTDDYSVLATLCADGQIQKKVVGSVVESLQMDCGKKADFKRLIEIFQSPDLQMVSFTITEKGYSLCNAQGNLISSVKQDFEEGPSAPTSYMGKTAALLYQRYLAGGLPLALVSMDNCSHNGDKLYDAIYAFAREWEQAGLVENGFVPYVQNREKVSFPWTMIDKITPRPDPSIAKKLEQAGLEEMSIVVTDKNTYTAPFVNAEESEYLVVEDWFPNGRPALERAGVYITDRMTVERTEKMKVCTCLNPLHTSLAVFGCLLNHAYISSASGDADLSALIHRVGYQEGLPVVTNPGIMDPKNFLDTVVQIRIPNPYLPDTPKRIATDTSQKLSIRFGETIRAYEQTEGFSTESLRGIPLVLAGWLRYLLAVDDAGTPFTLSPDPMADYLKEKMKTLSLRNVEQAETVLKPLLCEKKIFGVDLYEAGLADRVCSYFKQMTSAPGAVRRVLHAFAREQVLEEIRNVGIVPVLVLQDVKKAERIGAVLEHSGLVCVEVTFRTAAAAETIRRIRMNHPSVLVGAGTVLTTEQVDEAVNAGASFVVSPGLNPEIVRYCQEKGVVMIPGIETPGELEQAWNLGLRTVKFFPAELAGGLPMIKAMASAYTDMQFMPTGGIQAENVEPYLRDSHILACGGSWMLQGELIEQDNYAEMERRCKEAVALVKRSRGKTEGMR